MAFKDNNKTPLFYNEFLIPSTAYLTTIKIEEAVFEIALPAIMSIASFIGMHFLHACIDNIGFISLIIPLLSILIGFNSTCIVVLLTSNSTNIDLLKSHIASGRMFNKKQITLFQILFLNFAHILIIQVTLLIACIIIIFIKTMLSSGLLTFLTYILFFFLLHALFMTIRNTSNLFFSFWKHDIGTSDG